MIKNMRTHCNVLQTLKCIGSAFDKGIISRINFLKNFYKSNKEDILLKNLQKI